MRDLVEQAYQKEIEKIIGQFNCPKDLICYKSGFEVLCKAQDIGVESFLICLEEDPRKCKFSLPLERGDICECPLRIYIAKKLNK
jgi:hypothetical protein